MDKKEKGFIKVYRDIEDNFLWNNDEPFDRRSAWIDLIMMANIKQRKIMVHGKVITINKGSVYTSIRKLADRWGWSKDRVYRFLELLEAENMVKNTHATSYATLLTIENWGFYQGSRDKLCDTDKDADKDGHKDADKPLLKNGKNGKNGKNIYAPSEPSVDDEGGWEYVQF